MIIHPTGKFNNGAKAYAHIEARPLAAAMGAEIVGVDPVWANSALAYGTLSDTMKALLAPLKVHMSMGRVVATAQAHQAADDTPIGRVAATRDLAQLPAAIATKVQGSFHPLVRTH